MNIIGIDVSKAKLDVLWLRDPNEGKVKTKILANSESGHQSLIDWVEQSTGEPIDQCHCLMEATGIYQEALALALYTAGARVSVVNPAYIRYYAKALGVINKTDKKDSWVIALYGATQAVHQWQPEPEEIRTLKALIGRLTALEKDRARERVRLEHLPQTSARAIVIESIQAVVRQLDEEIQRLETRIRQHIDQHPALKRDQELLLSIPGVGPVVSRVMLAVLHSRDFKRASECAAFLGLNPVHFESGTSVHKRSRLYRTGSATVRARLYMAAVVCTRHNPDIQAQYQRLPGRGKAKKSAVCAAMRKLVHICFGVLKHQQPYQQQTLGNTGYS